MLFPVFSRRLISFLILILFFTAESLSLLTPAAVHAFSIKDEREYGEKMLAVIRKEFVLIDELDISQYLNTIGADILAEAGPQYFDYHFYLIDNKDFNAFAAPSGLIFLHSGIIEAMDTEGELISVMAHECGHVMSRHIADRIRRSTKINAGTMALVLAGIALGGGALSQALVTGGMATGATLSLQYSRQDEEEADRIGFKLMKAQHRNPRDMVTMLNKMYKVSKITMGKIPPYLLTHPEPKVRMSYVQDLIHFQPDDNYKDFSQFAFKRIQRRIAFLTEEPQKLFGRYRKIIRESKNEDEKIMASYGLALCHFSIGDTEQAIRELKKVIDHYPHEPVLLADLGSMYFQAGQFDTALVYLEEARNSDPGNWYITFHLARLLQQTGKEKRAQRLYEQLLGHLPDYPELYFQLAQIEGKAGNQAVSHFYLGYNFYFEGKFPLSRLHFNTAIELFGKGDKRKKEAGEMLEKIKKVE